MFAIIVAQELRSVNKSGRFIYFMNFEGTSAQKTARRSWVCMPGGQPFALWLIVQKETMRIELLRIQSHRLWGAGPSGLADFVSRQRQCRE